MAFFIAIVLLIVLLGVYGVSIYNKLVKYKNQVPEAWSGIDVQLKRRYDLIPNLINTVKGYAKHEKETLENVISLRNSALAVPEGHVNDQAQAENALSSALKSVFALAENYPDLKANQNFGELQKALFEVEDNIQRARRYYNAVVRDNNTYVESFPSMIVAQMANFQKYPFFEIELEERKNIEVTF